VLLIEGGTVIPCDGTRRILRGSSVAVDGQRILGVGKKGDLVKKFGRPERTIDAAGKYVLPGFVNTHTHLFQTLTRGVSIDAPLDRWWLNAVGRVAPFITGDDCYQAAQLASVEAVRSGTTCLNDFMYLATRDDQPKRVVESLLKAGVRGVLSRGITDAPSPRAPETVQDLGKAIQGFRDLFREYEGAGDGRMHVWVAPGSSWAATLKGFEESIRAAREIGARISFHCSETEAVVRQAEKAWGAKDLVTLRKKGLLGPDMLAVHCVWLDESDISAMAGAGVKVSHCPVTNMLLADGVAPIRKMLDAGVTCSLGSDGPASNFTMDMISVMKTASLLQKVHLLDSTAMSSWEVLEMATRGGARALGLESEIGSVSTGMKADLVVIDLSRPGNVPVYDPVASIVYSASPENVETVIIDGKVVLEGSRTTTVDEGKAMRAVSRIAERLGRQVAE
jgi:5-methylthioadenosine/S-adenosylhomocysteine deaminase